MLEEVAVLIREDWFVVAGETGVTLVVMSDVIYFNEGHGVVAEEKRRIDKIEQKSFLRSPRVTIKIFFFLFLILLTRWKTFYPLFFEK